MAKKETICVCPVCDRAVRTGDDGAKKRAHRIQAFIDEQSDVDKMLANTEKVLPNYDHIIRCLITISDIDGRIGEKYIPPPVVHLMKEERYTWVFAPLEDGWRHLYIPAVLEERKQGSKLILPAAMSTSDMHKYSTQQKGKPES